MGAQGAWTRWESATPKKLTWHEILQKQPLQLGFLLRSVYDLLPTPANLKLWYKTEDDACKLCGKRGTLEHVLSSCRTALTQGRYRWRHDKVLEAISSILEPVVNNANHTKPQKTLTLIKFVKAGEEQKRSGSTVGVLATATDWQLRVDLRRRLQFPGEITTTTLRPDIVLWSSKTRQVIMIELTVPWEENIQIANERKRTKYDELKASCEEAQWKAWCMPIEVGCRGFIGKSIWTTCKLLGIGGNIRKRLSKICENTAERTSNWIWLKRNDKEWLPS